MKRKKGKNSKTENGVDPQVEQKSIQPDKGLTRRKFFKLGGKVGLGSAAAYALGGLSELSAYEHQTTNYGSVGKVYGSI